MDDYKKSERKKFTIVCDGSSANIDELDYKLLNEIALNARIPLIDLTEKLSLSSQTVAYRLNNLIKSGVIKGFRVDVNINKLGLQFFDVRVNLRDHSKRMHIISHLQQNPYFKCLNTSIGYTDLELEFQLENMDKLNQIMDELNVKFPESIRTYFYFQRREIYKERWLPELY